MILNLVVIPLLFKFPLHLPEYARLPFTGPKDAQNKKGYSPLGLMIPSN